MSKGILYLPQLGAVSEGLVIDGITRVDAEGLLNDFAARVASSRRLATFSDGALAYHTTEAFYEVNAIGEGDLLEDGAGALIDFLSTSTLPRLRGERAVFFESDNYNDDEKAAILIGTAVVYNRNWATLGVVDTTVIDTIEKHLVESSQDSDGDDEDEDEDDGRCGWCGDYHY